MPWVNAAVAAPDADRYREVRRVGGALGADRAAASAHRDRGRVVQGRVIGGEDVP